MCRNERLFEDIPKSKHKGKVILQLFKGKARLIVEVIKPGNLEIKTLRLDNSTLGFILFLGLKFLHEILHGEIVNRLLERILCLQSKLKILVWPFCHLAIYKELKNSSSRKMVFFLS